MEVGNESTLIVSWVSMFKKIQTANGSDTVDATLPKLRVDPKCILKPLNQDAACDTSEILLTPVYRTLLPGTLIETP